MKLTVLTPEKIAFSGEVTHVSFPGEKGAFQVYENFAPLISSLKEGIIKFETPKNQIHSMAINGGFVEIHKNEVSACAESANDTVENK